MVRKSNSDNFSIRLILIIVLSIFFISSDAMALNIISNNKIEVKNFIGRKKLVDELKNKIKKEKNIFVSGESGIGKTQLIRKFVNLSKKSFDIVWWVDLEHEEKWQYNDLVTQIYNKTCSDKVVLDNISLQGVVKLLDKCKYKVLFIFDNVIDREKTVQIINKVENINNIQNIFISKKTLKPNESLEVNRFSKEESREYLNHYFEKNEDGIENLNNILGGHPLLLEQATSYIIHSKHVKIKDYIDIIKEKPVDVLKLHTNKIDIMDNYNYTPDNVIRTPVLEIKKDNVEAYKLLQKISFLSSEFDEEILKSLFKTRKNKFSLLEFSKALDIILEYNVIYCNKMTEKKIFNIHALKQKVIKESFGDEESLQDVVDTIINILPKEIGRLAAYIEANPILFDNMKEVYKNIIEKSVVNEPSIIFKIKLLNAYMVQYQYKEAGEILNSLEKDIEEASDVYSDEYRREIIIFRVLQGRYYRNKEFDDARAIYSLEVACNLLKNTDSQDLQFLVLGQKTLTYMDIGDINIGRKLMEKIDANLHEYINKHDMPLRPFYLHLKTNVYEEDGDYQRAISNILESIDSYDTKSEKRKLYEYLPLIKLYMKVGELTNALEYIRKCEVIINNEDDMFNNEKNLIHYYTVKAKYYHLTGDLLSSEKEILSAEKILQKIVNTFSQRQAQKYLIDIKYIQADILVQEEKYKKAIERYLEAESILLRLYNNKVEKRIFNEIYEKIVDCALRIDDKEIAKKYYNIQRENFGDDNAITQSIRKKINLADLKVL
jgi:hypothetical protein